MKEAIFHEEPGEKERREKLEAVAVAGMVALGKHLPRTLAAMPMGMRGSSVALLCAHVGLGAEVAGHLIVHPERVQIVEIGNADPDEELDKEIYKRARYLEERGQSVGKILGLAGLDWPPGSGDYHGGGPLSDDPEKLFQRHHEIAIAFAEMEAEEHGSGAADSPAHSQN